MENYRKSIGAIIILLLSTIFVHNANAAVNIDGFHLTNDTYSLSSSYDFQVYVNQNYQGAPLWVNGPLQWNGSQSAYIGIGAFRTKQSYDVKEGYIYKLSPSFFFRGPYSSTAPGALLQTINSNQYFKTVAVEPVQCESITVSPGNTQPANLGYSCVYDIYIQSKTTGKRQFLIGLDNAYVMFFLPPLSQGILTFAQDVSIFAPNENENAEEKIEEASNEGETNSQQADSDNQTASQNVIGVISNILGAFGTAAGDCTLPGNLGNLNVGNINLCQGKPPEIASIINVVGSIVIVYACYRVARNIFRIWLTITAFAQGNSKGGN